MAHLEFQQDQAGRRNSDKTNARNNQVSEQMQELLRRRKVMIEVRVGLSCLNPVGVSCSRFFFFFFACRA